LVAKPEGKLGYFYTIEGFECLRTPNDFDEFYDLGVRSFGFTWSFDNEYACGRHTKNDRGLTTKGLEVVEHMKAKEKLIVDIAHLSEQSVQDCCKSYDTFWTSTQVR
jgi:membrane dipeptidase